MHVEIEPGSILQLSISLDTQDTGFRFNLEARVTATLILYVIDYIVFHYTILNKYPHMYPLFAFLPIALMLKGLAN